MKRMLLILLLIPFFIQGQTTVTICDGDSALIYGNWQTNSGTYTNSNGSTTTLVVNPLPIITPNFVLNGDATIQPGNVLPSQVTNQGLARGSSTELVTSPTIEEIDQ